MSDADWAKVNYVQQSGPTVSAKGRRLVLFVLLDLAVAAVVTLSYLFTATYWPSIGDYFYSEVIEYTFATSTFDIWVLSVSRTLFVLLCVRRLPYPVVVVLLSATVIFAIVKTAAYEFVYATTYFTLILGGLLSPAIEAILWNLLLVRTPQGYAEIDETDDVREFSNDGVAYQGSPAYQDGPHVRTRAQYGGEATTSAALPYSQWTDLVKQQQVNEQRSRAPTHNALLRVGSPPSRRMRVGSNASSVMPDDASFLSAEEYSDDEMAAKYSRSIAAASIQNDDMVDSSRPSLAMTDEEYRCVKILEKRFPSYLPQELFLRFLRARDMDVTKASAMLENHLKFRAAHRLDELKFDVSPVPTRGFSYPDGNGTDNEHWSVQRLLKYNGCVLHKWTRDGLPLVIFPLGLSDAKGTAVNNSREDIENGVIVAAEFVGRALIPEMETRIGKRSTAALAFIVDLNGLGLRQFYMPALMLFNGFMSLAHEHYPETLGVVYLINVPTIFQMFWQVVRPFIPERTLKRIHFCSADYKQELLELVAPENLPAYLGGLCSCRCEFGCIPWPLTEGYRRADIDAEGYTTKSILPGQTFEVPVAMTRQEIKRLLEQTSDKKAVTLSWSFKSVQGELTFGVQFSQGFAVYDSVFPAGNNGLPPGVRDNRSIVKPAVAYDSNRNEVKGTVVVQQPGTYRLQWTNSTLRMTIQLRYKVY